VVLRFIFECGSRGGGFRIFRGVVPQRHNSVGGGASGVGSSAKVGSVAVGGAGAGQMMGRVVGVVFGVWVVESRFDLVETNNIFHLIPVRNREKV
jgi:hypothetical protein